MSNNINNLDDALQHWGVKGMKWGVRRDQNKPGGADGKPDAGSKRKSKDGKLSKASSKSKGSSKEKRNKIDDNEAVQKHGKSKLKTAIRIATYAYLTYVAVGAVASVAGAYEIMGIMDTMPAITPPPV